MSTRVSPLERVRAEIDDLFASDRDLGGGVGGGGPPRRAPVVADRDGGRGHGVLGPGALRAWRARPAGQPQRPLPDHDQDHGRPGHHRAPQAARHRRGFRVRGCWAWACAAPTPWSPWLSPASCGACRCGTWRPPWPTPSAREATLSKSTVSRICEAIKTEFDAWKSRDLSDVALEYLFSDGCYFKLPRRRPGRAGAGRLGDHHRGPARAGRPGAGLFGVDRRLGRVPQGPGRPGPAGPAAGHLRRRPRPHRRRRGRLPPQPAPTLPHSPGPQRPGQGARRAPGRGQGGVLEDLRRHRRRAGRRRHRRGPGPGDHSPPSTPDSSPPRSSA